MSTKRSEKLEGAFEGWSLDSVQGILYDSENNHYHIDEIRALFMFRQWQSDYFSNTNSIKSLKDYLDEKISAVVLPQITIDWGNGVIDNHKHPKYGSR